MKRNFQAEQDAIISGLDRVPTLLLHSCCGPCSSYCLEVLSRAFSVTVAWYNPNIHPREEYEKRLFYQKKLLSELPAVHPVTLLELPYDPEEYFARVKGLENEPEGGARCTVCFRQRLETTAREAKEKGFEFFTTTLTVSPHKNAPLINAIGEELAAAYGVRFLPSDFKKKEGYKRSIELSRTYDLYRQSDCGCVFSKREE